MKNVVTIKGGLYYDTNKNAALAWGSPYRWFPGALVGFGEIVPICEHTLVVDIGGFDHRPAAVKALEEKREELKAQFAAAVMEIEKRISELQAIEYKPEQAA